MPKKNRPFNDYKDEVNLHSSAFVRVLLLIAGSISLFLGILGVFLPLLPTTPFLLLSAICYGRASVRFYNWLMNNRYLGKYIRNWRVHGCIPLYAKILAITMIILTMGFSILFVVPLLAVKIGLGLIGTLIIIYLLRMPTKPPSQSEEKSATSIQTSSQSQEEESQSL